MDDGSMKCISAIVNKYVDGYKVNHFTLAQAKIISATTLSFNDGCNCSSCAVSIEVCCDVWHLYR